ncbi:MAG: MaoC family dehydratase [Rhodospirillaceae bacterium]|nr:MaoC family dehydratase [Rhodospirillaceae bacterium]
MKPGDLIFDVTRPGATRAQLAQFSAGTEDPNPIHVDEAFAKECGFPTVLQQGPMTTAHFGALLAERFGARLRSLDITFTAPVFPGEALRLTATVEKIDGDVALALAAHKADGTPTARGTATIAP